VHGAAPFVFGSSYHGKISFAIWFSKTDKKETKTTKKEQSGRILLPVERGVESAAPAETLTNREK
jgi:hypothetical protein